MSKQKSTGESEAVTAKPNPLQIAIKAIKTRSLDGVPDWMGVTGLGVIMLLGVALLINLQSLASRHSTGSAEGSNMIDDGSAKTLVLVDRIGDYKNGYERRVSAVDLESGAFAKRFFKYAGGCLPGASGLVWCQFGFGKKDNSFLHNRANNPVEINEAHDDGVMLLDGKTLSTKLVLDDAIDSAGLGGRVTAHWNIRKGIAWYLLDNGHGARVDPATLKVTVNDELPSSLTASDADITQIGLAQELTSKRECDGWDQIPKRNVAQLAFSSGVRSTLVRAAPTDLPPSGATFLSPQFLIDNTNGKPMVIDGDPIIIHNEKIVSDWKLKRSIISRIGKDGSAVWSLALGGLCERATVSSGFVIVSTGNEDQRAVALDAATGKIRWKVAF